MKYYLYPFIGPSATLSYTIIIIPEPSAQCLSLLRFKKKTAGPPSAGPVCPGSRRGRLGASSSTSKRPVAEGGGGGGWAAA